MKTRLTAPFTFLKQTLREFRHTGALAPSSPFLAKAMSKGLPRGTEVTDDYRVLEVGPGTGSVTEALIKRLGGRGMLDLYEINADFVKHLKQRIDGDKAFAPMKGRIRIFEGDVRRQPAEPCYDAVVSGLPFNNFQPDEVASFLAHFQRLIKPGGTLTYFEYVAMRKLQKPFVNRKHRERLTKIGEVVRDFSDAYQYRQRIVPMNIPPARVRYLRFE